jgi:shikimate kinase
VSAGEQAPGGDLPGIDLPGGDPVGGGARSRPGGPVCVLVGPPGAGKSTVGALLAARLGVPFVDSDELVAARAGRSIPEIFVDDGEDAFRAMERAAVADGLATPDVVLALGGGAVLAEATRELLSGRPVVYLSVELGEAVRRVGLGAGRPLLTLNPRATLKYLLDQRRPLYRQVAAVTVATDGLSAEEVAARVLAALPAPAGGTAA